MAAADSGKDLKGTIDYLIQYVASSDATFIRNGKSHPPKEAADHMRDKYEHFAKEIKTPEDFIRLAASKSLVSGESYYVIPKGGKKIACAQWLTAALKERRASP